MEGLEIKSESNRLVISIEKGTFTDEYVLNLIERMTVEYLAKKGNFDEKITNLAEEINKNWWEANGDAFLEKVKR